MECAVSRAIAKTSSVDFIPLTSGFTANSRNRSSKNAQVRLRREVDRGEEEGREEGEVLRVHSIFHLGIIAVRLQAIMDMVQVL